MPNAIDPKLKAAIATTERRISGMKFSNFTKEFIGPLLAISGSTMTSLGLMAAGAISGNILLMGAGAGVGGVAIGVASYRPTLNKSLTQNVSEHLRNKSFLYKSKVHDISIAKAYAYFHSQNGNIDEYKVTSNALSKETKEFKFLVHNAALAFHDAKGNISDPKVQQAMEALGERVEPKHMTQVSHQHYLTPAKSPIAPEATKSVFGRVAEFAKGKPWVTAASVAGVGLAGWAVTNALSKPEPSAPIASFSEREMARRHAGNAQADVAATVA